VFDAGLLGCAYRRRCLLNLVGAMFPKIGDQENAVCPFNCGSKGFRAVQVCFDDFLGEFAMLCPDRESERAA
jgi:hypothetical protein